MEQWTEEKEKLLNAIDKYVDFDEETGDEIISDDAPEEVRELLEKHFAEIDSSEPIDK